MHTKKKIGNTTDKVKSNSSKWLNILWINRYFFKYLSTIIIIIFYQVFSNLFFTAIPMELPTRSKVLTKKILCHNKIIPITCLK